MFRKVYKLISFFYLLYIFRYGKIKISNIKGVLKHNDYYQDRKEAIL
jgi:hypothetical protein